MKEAQEQQTFEEYKTLADSEAEANGTNLDCSSEVSPMVCCLEDGKSVPLVL